MQQLILRSAPYELSLETQRSDYSTHAKDLVMEVRCDALGQQIFSAYIEVTVELLYRSKRVLVHRSARESPSRHAPLSRSTSSWRPAGRNTQKYGLRSPGSANSCKNISENREKMSSNTWLRGWIIMRQSSNMKVNWFFSFKSFCNSNSITIKNTFFTAEDKMKMFMAEKERSEELLKGMLPR